jgi:hypothetical protein
MLSPSVFGAGSWILYIVHEGRPQQMPGKATGRRRGLKTAIATVRGWRQNRREARRADAA